MFNIFMIFLMSFGVQAKDLNYKKHKKGAFVPGEVIVKFKDAVDEKAQIKFISKLGVFANKKTLNNKISILKLSDAKLNVLDAVKTLKNNPDVEYAEPNYKVWINKMPTKGAKYSNQWGLKNTGQTLTEIYDDDDENVLETTPADSVGVTGKRGKDIEIEDLWTAAGSDCSNTKIAIIDTGLNPYIADFSEQTTIINYYNAITGDECVDGSCTLDLNGHGTHVAGIIAGDGVPDINGVCSKAELLIIKAMSDDGAGDMYTISNAITYASTHGAKVANLSLGGWYQYAPSVLLDAVEDASTNDMMLIVAAGNDGYSSDGSVDGGVTYYTYPCAINAANLMCIGAMDMDFNMANFSNYGAFSVDIGAPGTNILSSYIKSYSSDSDDWSSWEGDIPPWQATLYGSGSSSLYAQQFPSTFDMSSTSAVPSSTFTNAVNGKFISYNLGAVDKFYVNFYTTFYLPYLTETAVHFNANGLDAMVEFYSIDDEGNLTRVTLPNDDKNFVGDYFDSYYYTKFSSTLCDNAVDCLIKFKITSTTNTEQTGGFAVFAFNLTAVDENNYTKIQAYESGTSMATPFAVGVYALLKSLFPTKSMYDIASAMMYNEGTVFEPTSYSFATKNVLNAKKAYDALNTSKLLPPNYVDASY